MTRFLGGLPRFRRNILSKEKLVDEGVPVVKVISLLLCPPLDEWPLDTGVEVTGVDVVW